MDAHELLRTSFGFPAFRPGQAEALQGRQPGQVFQSMLSVVVTRITLPVRSDGLLSMDLHFVRLDAFALGLRQPAGEMRPGPEERCGRAERAGHGPDHARALILRSDAGPHH